MEESDAVEGKKKQEESKKKQEEETMISLSFSFRKENQENTRGTITAAEKQFLEDYRLAG